MLSKRLVYILIALLAISSVAIAQEDYEPTFEPTDCLFNVPDGATVECGYVTVPEDRDGDLTDTIRLYTSIWRSGAEEPAGDPVVFVQGGPGGGSVAVIHTLRRTHHRRA